MLNPAADAGGTILSEVYRNEIFGPVLEVMRVATYADAVKLVNDNPYGNRTAIFTRDGGAARQFQFEAQVGMVGIRSRSISTQRPPSAKCSGGIVASGWHGLSVTMRLMVGSDLFNGGPIVGVGIDRLRFLQPIRAGERLRAAAEVLEVRPSRTHARRGYLVLRITTQRSDGTPVLMQDWTLLVPRRMVPG